jgi:ligand-binding sensor domain-containing protein
MKRNTITISTLFICCFLSCAHPFFAQFINPEISKYAFNDRVLTIAEDSDGNVYFGGDFTAVGIYSGSGVLINSDGLFNQPIPDNIIDGVVHTVITMPGGGWLIGGLFTSINGVPRNNLARVNANGTLHSFAPVINGAVRALAFDSEGELYVGGSFTQVNGLTRNRLCKFNATSGLSNFNPNMNQDVNALAVDASDRLYVGGSFTSIGNSPRARLCRFLNNGALQAFNPAPNGPIYAIVIDNFGSVYVGGAYFGIGGANRNNLCKFDNSDAVTSFHPNPNGRINALAFDSDNGLYVGGEFTIVAVNVARNRLCHYDANGSLTSFDPSLDGNVRALAVDAEGSLYVGGDFSTVGASVVRNRFCKFDSTGILSSFDVGVNTIDATQASVFSLAVNSNGQLYLGGDFDMLNAVHRSRFCKIDHEGEISSFSPSFDDRVNVIKINESNEVYVGGEFSMVNNISRKTLCKFDANGDINSFNPLFNNTSKVFDIALDDGGNLYVGGSFNAVNGVQRNQLCKFEMVGSLSDFNPDLSGDVEALVTDENGNVYVGGDFSFVDGVIRRRLCKFDSNGVLQPLSASIWNRVRALALDANQNLYVGGDFDEVNGIDLKSLCRFDSSGQLTDFEGDFDGGVFELQIDDEGSLYVGGNFINVNDNARNGLCKFDNTGELTPFGGFTFQPGVESILIHSNGSVYAGGAFFKHLNIYTCNSSTALSNNPSLCLGESLSTASHSTSGALGIGMPIGLPTGVEAAWDSGEIILSGSPIETGSFEYTIPLEGDCGVLNAIARGTISIGVSASSSEASSSPTLCIHTALPVITHATSDAFAISLENVSGANGLPLGVRAIWNENVLNIVGIPTEVGVFEYSIPVLGDCGDATATGIIIVNGADVSVTNADTLLTATAVGATYQWIDCSNNVEIAGEINSTFAPLLSGSYAVMVSAEGCSYTSDCEDVIIISVDEEIGERELHVFPNPTSGTIQIDLTNHREIIYLDVKNVLGQTILSSRVQGENVLMLNIPGEAGTYFLEFLKTDGAKEVVKVSKQ